jgi:miniconductance mechanosensitive channel
VAYLKAHPGIHQDMTLIVRQLDARGEGIPLELYCFTRTTDWSEYEGILSDIFDHLIAILPEFGLSLYQKPAGGDLREALKDRGRKPETDPESAGWRDRCFRGLQNRSGWIRWTCLSQSGRWARH